MRRKIIIAGGGTGGHIFPAIAIAGALKKQDPDIELLFVGAKGKMEMEKVPQAGYTIEGIDIAGLNRSSLIKNIGLPWLLVKSFFQVRGIIRRFMPDAVVGVGGYSSFPVLRAAQAKGIPTFIHESNSFAGKANQWLGKKATTVFVATDGMEKFFPAGKIKVTGNPVRANLVGNTVSREAAIRFFGLDPAQPTVLVTGGSLGAKGINEAVAAGIEEFGRNGAQLIWQTGKPFAATAAEICKDRKNIWTGDFITKMEYSFPAGDVVISRAGAISIAELCVAGKAVIFVPFPFAAEDHQTVNAQHLVNKGAGLLVKDSEAKEKLVATAVGLLKDEPGRRQLEENIGKLGVTNADEVIAREILRAIEL